MHDSRRGTITSIQRVKVALATPEVANQFAPVKMTVRNHGPNEFQPYPFLTIRRKLHAADLPDTRRIPEDDHQAMVVERLQETCQDFENFMWKFQLASPPPSNENLPDYNQDLVGHDYDYCYERYHLKDGRKCCCVAATSLSWSQGELTNYLGIISLTLRGCCLVTNPAYRKRCSTRSG